MNVTSLAYATYWRTSLADADLGNGALRYKDLTAFHVCPGEKLQSGCLGDAEVTLIFKDEPADVETISITIRPYVYRALPEHGTPRGTGIPEVVTPIVSQAFVDRTGMIYPGSGTVIPRDILEPLERGSFSIADVSDFDKWLQTHLLPQLDLQRGGARDADLGHNERWLIYREYCTQMLATVANGWPAEDEPFVPADYWLIAKSDSFTGASRHIISLYDHLRAANPSAPLFETYACEDVSDPVPCFPANSGFTLRLGHASDAFPLSDAQRDAMTHQLLCGPSEILAVNGPPGTGKTTLVLSVVASYWVRAALEGAAAPVIVAASTNNQAVTNIIDSFAKDFSPGTGPFAGRWLPGVRSYGSYFPSLDKEKEAAGKYQTRAFFDSVENAEYLARAEVVYLEAASAAFPELLAPSVQAVVDRLAETIRLESDKLVTIERAWDSLRDTKQELHAELGDDPVASLRDLGNAVAVIHRQVADLTELKMKWESYLSREPFVCLLFCWFPPVGKKRLLMAKEFLKPIWPVGLAPGVWTSVDEISVQIDRLVESHAAILQTQQQRLQTGKETIDAYGNAVRNWELAVQLVSLDTRRENVTLAECDCAADKTIRFHAFRLATHYWEGMWLLEMNTIAPSIAGEKTKNGRAAVQARWRRRMKITPCAVSTFYILPKAMICSRYDNGAYLRDYLYDFVDLLIVDEAGQVLPEVAGASFSLAKRAMVIGDTMQIEPIWSIKSHVDIGNLISAGVMRASGIEERYDTLRKLGKTAASGSVMEIAQLATRYHYDPEMARGMFLYEHRRCYDEIVAYCNALCYCNKLKPMRGSGGEEGALPAMGYHHINGICQRRGAGSRQNKLEAETIASWITDQRDRLEKRYGKGVAEIVGVVTPFGGQVAAISEACRAKGIPVGKNEGEMTVGTVHSLQGAERAVVIFSPTYSIHADGGFMDRSQSMLNVAVSRAQDSFLVFGDMDIFNPRDKGRPRGLLASFLFAEEGNSLHYMPLRRSDIGTSEKDVRYLHDADQHHRFLLEALKQAAREVHIVSPWLRLQRMEQAGIVDAMMETVARGVAVTVYADQLLNFDRSAVSEQEARRHWVTAAKALDEAGVALVDVPMLHSKILIQDDAVLCIGSFNWLSAAGSGKYARHETSISYTGPKIATEAGIILQSLAKRARRT